MTRSGILFNVVKMTRGGLVPTAVMRASNRIAARWVFSPAASWTTQRRRLDALFGLLNILPPGVVVATATVGGRPTDILTPTRARPDAAVLVLHGGGYTTGSPGTHRGFAGYLADSAGLVTYVPDYRLAPENRYPAALDDALAAYDDLREEHCVDHVVIVGDSAGGGLALALALRIRDTGRPSPAALVLVCPLTDLTDVESKGDADNDPVLRRAWIAGCVRAYLGDVHPNDPTVSPVYADLTGLAPMLVQSSQHDILRRDGERIATAARQAGVDVTYEELPRLWHVAHLNAGIVNDATAAVTRIGEFLRTALPTSRRGR